MTLAATPVAVHNSARFRDVAPRLPVLAPSTTDSIIGAVRRLVLESESERARRGRLRIVIRPARSGFNAWVVEGGDGGALLYRVERRKTFWRDRVRWVAVPVAPLESATTRPRP